LLQPDPTNQLKKHSSRQDRGRKEVPYLWGLTKYSVSSIHILVCKAHATLKHKYNHLAAEITAVTIFYSF